MGEGWPRIQVRLEQVSAKS
jgi:hypothetical protein